MILLVCIFLLIILINDVFLAIFSFQHYTAFLFNSTEWLLHLFGYEAYVDQNNLIGPGGFIHMAKFCLGINTMTVFASFVLLTGKDWRKIIPFVVIGLILINLVNILRFFFIFIHIQNNSGYQLGIEIHDLLDLIIYSFIFVLWVIWIERFSGILRKPDDHDKNKK
ncbi:MAG: archaeosortase/exosortase family protein [Bacteroidales bacterium]|nr:archaeosortase/exosortase family protein [Bacteroidales bacterium]